MMPLYLIILFTIFVLYSMRRMISNGDDLYALAFLSLFIYTIFTQIGYAYYPQLSKLFGAYFGPELFYEYWGFMFLSFVLSFLLYTYISRGRSSIRFILKKSSQNTLSGLFGLFVFILYTVLNIYFYKNRIEFGYGGGNPMGGPWFGIGFLFFQSCTFIMYTLFRDKTNGRIKRVLSFLGFILCFIFFLRVTVAAASRSDILYFFVALSFYELTPLRHSIKYQKRKILLFLLVGGMVFSTLSTLRAIRNQDRITSIAAIINYEDTNAAASDQGLPGAILMQDYFLPSHTLFISMKYDIIDPIEVLKSNAANALVTLNYPFLTNTILYRGLGIKNDRGVGWAYQYFVEGYNALGFFGIFYNALFWNLGMILFSRLAKSNSHHHNKVMIAISALIISSAMKGQTGLFLKYYWLILFPAMVLLLMANNSSISFVTKRK